MKWRITAEYHAASDNWTATASSGKKKYGCTHATAMHAVRSTLYMIGDRDADVTVTIKSKSWALADSCTI